MKNVVNHIGNMELFAEWEVSSAGAAEGMTLIRSSLRR
jgi:hypothetical protein